MNGATLRIGTRGSALARAQTNRVVDEMRRLDPSLDITIHVIQTQGDLLADTPFSEISSQGVFVREIERALLDGHIDLAVNSYKDMPTETAEGLTVIAFPPRADPRDALVSDHDVQLSQLPDGATVGTGSPRRRLLLLDLRPDLEIVPLRGNVDTRVRRVREHDVDATVLAVAGLARLGRESELAEQLDPARFVPAVGQGILALECRAQESWFSPLAATLDDAETRLCAQVERAIASAVGASCQTPLGAYARLVDGQVRVEACLAASASCQLGRVHGAAPPTEALALGRKLGRELAALVRHDVD